MLHSDLDSALAAAKERAEKRPSRRRCLLVEDSRFDRRRVQALAQSAQLDLEIVEASSLREARSHMSRDEFDLVLLDNFLPDGEGLVAIETFRAGEEGPVPVILLSGQSNSGMQQRAMDAGCSEYLQKDGLSGTVFREAVERALARALEPVRTEQPDQSVKLREVLETFAYECVGELRVPLSRMLRHISLASERHPNASADFDLLSENCRELFAYLDEIRSVAEQDGMAAQPRR
ncbi:response regulator [Paroceanicella profunda]|uniref:Response regulator n=1 Tax=Paroceanicella profunda TaxID=2579971 RepID=A0A5B8FWZ2_9RHOB|nr:response regulator [Paroceanicella profunda]QDL91019.1 response regulator [Paroceanicella profunda]